MIKTKKECVVCKQPVLWKHVLFTFDGFAICRKCFNEKDWKKIQHEHAQSEVHTGEDQKL